MRMARSLTHSLTHLHTLTRHTRFITIWNTIIKQNAKKNIQKKEKEKKKNETTTKIELSSLQTRIMNAKNVNLRTYFDRGKQKKKKKKQSMVGKNKLFFCAMAG